MHDMKLTSPDSCIFYGNVFKFGTKRFGTVVIITLRFAQLGNTGNHLHPFLIQLTFSKKHNGFRFKSLSLSHAICVTNRNVKNSRYVPPPVEYCFIKNEWCVNRVQRERLWGCKNRGSQRARTAATQHRIRHRGTDLITCPRRCFWQRRRGRDPIQDVYMVVSISPA